MAIGNILCKAAIVYGYRESSGIRISAWAQAVLECEHQQMFRLAIGEDATEYPGLCNREELTVLRKVSYATNRPTVSINFAHIPRWAQITIVLTFY